MQTIQMHLSQEPTFFAEFFSAFFESALIFEHFQKKMTRSSLCIFEIPTTKDVSR